MYQKPDKEKWRGRIDSVDNPSDYRWHQAVHLLDLSRPENIPGPEKKIAFLGFVSDEGVRRNQGRTGAAQGPDAIRKALSNLAMHFSSDHLKIYDAGDVICTQGKLEAAQKLLAEKVSYLLANGFFPVLLGGGHEIAYGHYQGIAAFLKSKGKTHPGIINFDAHFDLRPFHKEVSSGTPFRQILEENSALQNNFPYLCLGIQEASNTRSLFKTADKHGVQYVFANQLTYANSVQLKEQINAFLSNQEGIYLSIDLDVFASAFAPGVSAPALNGIFPNIALHLLQEILASGKVISLDIAELNPEYDIDNRTAKLAAAIIYEVGNWVGIGNGLWVIGDGQELGDG